MLLMEPALATSHQPVGINGVTLIVKMSPRFALVTWGPRKAPVPLHSTNFWGWQVVTHVLRHWSICWLSLPSAGVSGHCHSGHHLWAAAEGKTGPDPPIKLSGSPCRADRAQHLTESGGRPPLLMRLCGEPVLLLSDSDGTFLSQD